MQVFICFILQAVLWLPHGWCIHSSCGAQVSLGPPSIHCPAHFISLTHPLKAVDICCLQYYHCLDEGRRIGCLPKHAHTGAFVGVALPTWVWLLCNNAQHQLCHTICLIFLSFPLGQQLVSVIATTSGETDGQLMKKTKRKGVRVCLHLCRDACDKYWGQELKGLVEERGANGK